MGGFLVVTAYFHRLRNHMKPDSRYVGLNELFQIDCKSTGKITTYVAVLACR